MPDARSGDKPPASDDGRTIASGRTVFGRYQAFASLGSGGMADVFLAIARGPKGFNKLVVIKSLKKELSGASSFVDMFLDEARLAARLNHPNVVLTHEVDDSDGNYFIAMEFLEGQSLNKIIDHLKKHGESLGVPVAARLVSDALAGLHYAHELRDYDGAPLQIIHRDISPHNLFVTYEGQVKVVDFGIAKAVSSSTHTEIGVLKGKVAYMSPEQATGEAIDRRADLYAMGIVLWETLTLAPFSKGESTAVRLVRLLGEGVPLVSSIVPDIDPELDALVAKSLDKDPDKRFQTAKEMRDALEAFIAKTGVTVRQEDIGRRITKMFQSVRTEVERKVRGQMEAVSADTRIEDLVSLSLGGGSGAGSGSSAGSGSGSGASKVQTGGTRANVGVTVKPKAKTRTIGITAAAVVAVTVLGAWQWSRTREAASASVGPAPSASAATASAEIDPGRTESFGPLPSVVVSPTNPLSDEKIALGRMLYYDTRLSKGHDQSCNSCHALDNYGVDGKTVSAGHAQQLGTRNSPSVYNSAGYFALMWDGRFPDVEEQAKGPLLNPIEMSMTPKRVEETLQSIPAYVDAFGKAFPGTKSPVTLDNAARAIGAFERKLFTPSRWEKFLAGETGALTDPEKIGFNTFVETGCPTCHYGPYVGATMFQKLGLVKAWPYVRDRGKYELTQKNEDYMVFRVPSLRNVLKTAPYLHNGSLTQLSEVVRMMARHQIGKELSEAQANAIVTWLGALTGDLPTDYIKKPELPPNGKKTPEPEL